LGVRFRHYCFLIYGFTKQCQTLARSMLWDRVPQPTGQDQWVPGRRIAKCIPVARPLAIWVCDRSILPMEALLRA